MFVMVTTIDKWSKLIHCNIVINVLIKLNVLDTEIFGTDNYFNNYFLHDQFDDHCLAYIAGYFIRKVEKVV